MEQARGATRKQSVADEKRNCIGVGVVRISKWVALAASLVCANSTEALPRYFGYPGTRSRHNVVHPTFRRYLVIYTRSKLQAPSCHKKPPLSTQRARTGMLAAARRAL